MFSEENKLDRRVSLLILSLTLSALLVIVSTIAAVYAQEQYSFVRAFHVQGFGTQTIPNGIAVDSLCKIYVTDTGSQFLFNASIGPVFTRQEELPVQQFNNNGLFAGSFDYGNFPTYVTVDSSQNKYVTDDYGIQKFNGQNRFEALLAAAPVSTPSPAFFPFYYKGLALDSQNKIYVATLGGIQKFTNNGMLITSWNPLTSHREEFGGIAVDSSDNVYVTVHGTVTYHPNRERAFDDNLDQVQKYHTTDGIHYSLIRAWGSPGQGAGQFSVIKGIALDSVGNVFVVDEGNDRVQKFTNDGRFITSWGSTGQGHGQFNAPQGIDVDSSDNVYVSDSGNRRIQIFDSASSSHHQCGEPNTRITSAAIDTRTVNFVRPGTESSGVSTVHRDATPNYDANFHFHGSTIGFRAPDNAGIEGFQCRVVVPDNLNTFKTPFTPCSTAKQVNITGTFVRSFPVPLPSSANTNGTSAK
jgi:hypothetical protein